MFRKVLIANRGEIAVRIIRTLKEMGIASVAVFSDADRDALFVQNADEAYHLGPAPAGSSYLNIDAILSVACQANADAVHPGYGFLAENSSFAEAVAGAGMAFIGPSPRAISIMGDKVEARRAVQPLGVPLVPGSPGPVRDAGEARRIAAEIGYPIAVKAAGGGGGRGIRVVRNPGDLEAALESASREAEAYFKNPEVYIERYFDRPRHVEIQVLGDAHGTLVHLGERDCSIQRRHQKVIEETPSPAVDRGLRARMGEAALAAARSVDYTSAGTVEFLLAEDGRFYFLEMNTRIQVEHPITERVTGVDLIREMVLIAAGDPTTVRDSILDPNGHAIEVRINAEDPLAGFRPTPSRILQYREAGGIGIRVDSGVYAGYTIPQDYDSLMAKLISWAPDRDAARRRLLRALDEYVIAGPSSTITFAAAVLSNPVFVEGRAWTTFVESRLDELTTSLAPAQPVSGAEDRLQRSEERTFQVEVNRKLFTVRVTQLGAEGPVEKRPATRSKSKRSQGNDLVSPMHGTVIAVRKSEGESVEAGDVLFVIEAMKMENEVAAHRSGTIAGISAGVGDTVETGQVLAVIE